MSQFRALSEEVEGLDGEGSVDLGVRPLTPRPLTPQDEQAVDDICSLLVSGQEDAVRNAQPRTPSKDPNDPRGCCGSGTGGACRKLFPPEKLAHHMSELARIVGATAADQETAQAEIQDLNESVKKHQKRIAELEGNIEKLRQLFANANRKRPAEAATGQGPSKRPVPVAP